ncbi:MAG: hypothetical protein ACI4XP_07165, partial [Acutalibacteraceae bacterium]
MKKHTYTIFIAVVVTILMSISVVSFSSYAVEESSDTSLPSELSSEITSAESTDFSSVVAESSAVQSSVQSSSFPESSVQKPESSEPVSKPQSVPESSVPPESSFAQSSVPQETSPDESSKPESSYEESLQESEDTSITSPFSALNNLDAVLPVDRPDYIPPESSLESSFQSSQDNFESSTESQNSAAAVVSKTENNILNAPPVPTDEQVPKQIYSQRADNSSFLIGVIIWSVIGACATDLSEKNGVKGLS